MNGVHPAPSLEGPRTIMPALRILILSDGRPGHFNISEGIAAALGRRFRTDVLRHDVRRGRWPGALLGLMVNGGVPASAILRQVYGIDPGEVPAADLIVSAGAETLAANVALARLQGAPNIFYGSLRLFAPRHFSLVLTSYARQARHPNQLMSLKPSRLERLPAPLKASGDGRRVALLVGGDGGGVHFAAEDWDRLLAFIVHSHKDAGWQWSVTNSRRTPPAVTSALAALASGASPAIARLVDAGTPDTGTLADVLAAGDVIAVTSDSSTMLSEAVQLGRPVLSLSPQQISLTRDEATYRRYLQESGWVASLAIADLSIDRFEAASGGVRPMKYNFLDTLADLVTSRIPALSHFDRRG